MSNGATVGFIGLGIMGKPMVRNLVKAGYRVVAHSRNAADAAAFAAQEMGVTVVGSPAEVAAQASVVITMLPDSPDVRSVVFGQNGLAGALAPGSLLIDMSTIAPATAVEVDLILRERGSSALDAPVSGGDRGAIAGTLSIMVGGSADDFERARPYFEAMGKTIVHVGGAGAGQTVKACNQIVVAINYAAVSEALVMGAKAGVDPLKIIEVLNGGLAASRVMELRGASMVEHNFQPGFRVRLHRKDLGIALATGREQQVPLPVTALVAQFFETLAATGRGDLDHSSYITLVEEGAGYSLAEPEA